MDLLYYGLKSFFSLKNKLKHLLSSSFDLVSTTKCKEYTIRVNTDHIPQQRANSQARRCWLTPTIKALACIDAGHSDWTLEIP